MLGALAGDTNSWTRNEATMDGFVKYQEKRRHELWRLLGDLPERSEPSATLRKRERDDGFTVEHLYLDLNGIETVPALLLIPDKVDAPAPGLVYMHWHGGDYDIGKRELLQGNGALKRYAPVLAEKGIVTLAIDSWCFGERMTYPHEKERGTGLHSAGHHGESDTFKEMLWKGQVLWGMMMFDEWQALNYLCARPEVDP